MLIEAGSGSGFFGVRIWIQSKSSGSTTLVSGVIDTADQCPAVSLTPLTTKNRFHSQISPQIRSHIQKDFNPWFKGPNGVV
jgi:hypothetical protein